MTSISNTFFEVDCCNNNNNNNIEKLSNKLKVNIYKNRLFAFNLKKIWIIWMERTKFLFNIFLHQMILKHIFLTTPQKKINRGFFNVWHSVFVIGIGRFEYFSSYFVFATVATATKAYWWNYLKIFSARAKLHCVCLDVLRWCSNFANFGQRYRECLRLIIIFGKTNNCASHKSGSAS